MTKVLVAYYSWSGKTAKLARAIAKMLAADVEEIRDVKPRSGFFGYVRSALEASQHKLVEIAPALRNVADYDVVILGAPVWAHNMASPMRSYIVREKSRIRQLAVFCTLGGSGAEATLDGMSQLCGLAPIAKLQVRDSTLTSGTWRIEADEFARAIRARAAQPASAPA